METRRRLNRSLRWALSVLIVAAGLTTAWAWGRVAQLAEPPSPAPAQANPTVYAAWQPTGAPRSLLFRSSDQGVSWEPLALPDRTAPTAWAGDMTSRVAVALFDGRVFRSEDRGETWVQIATDLTVLSLAWDGQGDLYLGTQSQGIYRQAAAGVILPVPSEPQELVSRPVSQLVLVGSRLFAVTPAALFYSDDGGEAWAQTQSVPGGISALTAIDARTLYVGTASQGIFRSADAGQSWEPVSAGLGEAAGLSLGITALQADPQAAGVLYASVSYVVGGAQLHTAAIGTFVTVDGGGSWLPLAGPTFPEAQSASELLVAPGKPLHVGSVAVDGLQSYAPDLAGAFSTLQQAADAPARANAARLLGLARAQGANGALMAALRDSNPAVSLAAGEALGRIADPATTGALLEALQSADEQAQRSAATALGLMRAEAAVEPLSDLLLRGDPALAGVAAGALGRIGSTGATQALLTALSDSQLSTRRHAALGSLESMGEPAVAPLAKMLASADASARSNAAEALGWIGSQSATAALVNALGDSDSAVRAQAAWALGEVAAPQARAALERAQTGDPSLAVRQAAEQALPRLAQEPAVRTSLVASWGPVLGRWEMLRWLIPALSLLAAAWVLMGDRRRALAPAVRRLPRR